MHRTTDSVAMPFVTLASLTANLASAALHLAGQTADDASAKGAPAKGASSVGAPAKHSGKGKAPSDTSNLANAFAACLAAASAAAPVVPIVGNALAGIKIQTGQVKSDSGVPVVSLPGPPTASAAKGIQVATKNGSLPIVAAPKTTTSPPSTPQVSGEGHVSAKPPSPVANRVAVVPTTKNITAAASPARPSSTPAKTAATTTAETPAPAPAMSQEGKDEVHVGVHTTVESTALEIMPSNHEQSATKVSVSAVSTPSAAKVDGDSATPTDAVAAQQPAPRIEELIGREVSKQSVMESTEKGIGLIAPSRIVPTAAVLRSSAAVAAMAASTPAPTNHNDSPPQAQMLSSTPAGPTIAANLPVAPGSPAPQQVGAPSPPPMPVAEQLTRAFVSHADVVGQQGRTDFHLRLDPPQLGSVRIHLTAADNTISARIVAAQEGTQQLLQSQAHHLRQGLAQAGLSLGSFDVARDGGGSSGGRQAPPEPPLLPPPAGSPMRTTTAASTPLHRPTVGLDILA